LLYGANGFVGRVIARTAVERGLTPVLAGRNDQQIRNLAGELDLEWRVFSLDDDDAIDEALRLTDALLHCAGPFLSTYEPMVRGCLRTGTHYLDLTGELPVYMSINRYGAVAVEKGIMLLPGAGFDVVATDCLALHLKQRLPSANRLILAFHSQGPAGFPPGTVNTFFRLIPYGDSVRRDGRLVPAPRRERNRMIDFGHGPIEATSLTWGDIAMAHYSTGVPNIEDYSVMPMDMRWMMRAIRYARPIFSRAIVRKILRRAVRSGSTAEQRAASMTHVWGEATDGDGALAVSRMHGPDAGVGWTTICALDVLERVLAGEYKTGFQTPGSAFGPELALEARDVTWEDVN
jgi:short subunit dehydrogenase-like uncharacterized protein